MALSEEQGGRKVVPMGLCYEYAYKYQKAHGGIMVQGTVHDPWDGHAFGHAWVEKGGKAIDWQNMEVRGRGPRPVAEFYETWKPVKMETFDRDEALLAYAHNRYFGPWDKESAKSRVMKGNDMNVKAVAQELVMAARELVSVKFDTKKEMDEYKREHGQRPGTKVELRDKREMQERYKDKKSSTGRTAAAGPHTLMMDLERAMSRGPASFDWDYWIFAMGHTKGADYVVGAGEPIVRNLIALGLEPRGPSDMDKKRVWHVLSSDIGMAVRDNEIFRGMSAERCFDTWKDYMQGKRAVASELVKVAKSLVAGGWRHYSEDLCDVLEALPMVHKGKDNRYILNEVHRDRGLVQMMRDEGMSDRELMELLDDSREMYHTATGRVASEFAAGDYIMQRQRDEFDNIYALVIGQLLNGGYKVVAIQPSRRIPAMTSTKGWYPSPMRINREDVPANLLPKLEKKAREIAAQPQVMAVASEVVKVAKELVAGGKDIVGGVPAKEEFKVGDILDPQGKTNMVGLVKIREISGNILKFVDSEGTEYYGMQRSLVRSLINGGSWKRVTETH